MLSYNQRKYDLYRRKFKAIAINKGNDQSTFHALVAAHIIFCEPKCSVKN